MAALRHPVVDAIISSYWSVPMPNQPLNIFYVILTTYKFIIYLAFWFSNVRLPVLVWIYVDHFFTLFPLRVGV